MTTRLPAYISKPLSVSAAELQHRHTDAPEATVWSQAPSPTG